MDLRVEWYQLIGNLQSMYIYGAGKIGKKILNLIKKEEQLSKVKGIIVTNKEGNPASIENIPIFQIKDVCDKELPVLIAVTDIYQTEIKELLKENNFKNIIVAYKYSFLAEESEENKKIPDVIEIDVRELMLQQFNDGEFNRYDIIVRMLAAEEYYGLNDYGLALYSKMQNVRVHSEYGETAKKRYHELIRSVEENGFDSNSEIIVDKELKLQDGAHRLALALYHGVEKVKVRILNKESDIYYGIEWFEADFTKKEIQLIQDKFMQISVNWYYPIKGIIWPSAMIYKDDILEFVQQKYSVIKYEDYEFPQEIFEQFVRGIYHIDNIAKWKVETKIRHFVEENIYQVRIMDIDIPFPQFRIKNSGSTLSQEGEKLKKAVRNRYKEKINNYFHDIIFHTADNFGQSYYMDALMKPVFSLRTLFDEIRDFQWMLIKTENNYFPENFPDAYPMYKDIDLICNQSEAKSLIECIRKFWRDYEDEQYEVRIVKKSEDNTQIRFELKGFLIFLVDVINGDACINPTFWEESLKNRFFKDGYYVAKKEDEMIYRLLEVYRKPHKQKHRIYILENCELLDNEFIKKSLEEEYVDAVVNCLRNVIGN